MMSKMTTLKKVKRYVRESYLLGHFPSSRSALFSNRHKLAYFGFLGDGNVGDEMVYWAAKKLLSDSILIPLKRRMPLELKLRCRKPEAFFDGVVFGGGTLINQYPMGETEKRLLQSGLPVFVHGTGVVNGDLPRDWEMLDGKIYGGVRGPVSQQYISHLADTPIAGDAVMALEFKRSLANSTTQPRVLLNLGTHEHNEHGCEREVEECVIRLVEQASMQGLAAAFVPFHHIDCRRAEKLSARIPSLQVLPMPKTMADLRACFEGVEFAFGERLHFVITAALFGCAFASVNYASKHVDFLRSVGLEHCGFAPHEINCKLVERLINERGSFDGQRASDRARELRCFQELEADRFGRAVTQRAQAIGRGSRAVLNCIG